MKQSIDSFALNRDYQVPVEMFWRAITEREHMKQWYFDFAGDFRLEMGQTFEWKSPDENGKLWLHRGKMLEIVAEKKLAHSWEYPGYAGYSIVTWELNEIDKKTTGLVFVHQFVIPFDPNENSLKTGNFHLGWDHILNKELVEYLKKI